MDTVLKIATLISTDIRSRANANKIRAAIQGVNNRFVLDFSGVVFISRSFADELYNVEEEHGNIMVVNVTGTVQAMLDAVSNGRKHKRMVTNSDAEVKEFNDMASLSAFLATI